MINLLRFASISALLAVASASAFGESFNADNSQGISLNFSVDAARAESVILEGPANYTAKIDGELVIPETVEYNGVIYTVRGVDGWAFMSKGITSVVFPSTIETLGEGAFQGNDFETIILPDSMLEVGSECFSNCESLTVFSTGWGIKEIPQSLLSNCYALSLVYLNSDIASIGLGAFYGDTNLTKIVSHAVEPPVASVDSFLGVPSTCLVEVPAGSEEKYKLADGWKEFQYADIVTAVEGVESGSDNGLSMNGGCLVSDSQIQVYNLQGRMVMNCDGSVDLSALPKEPLVVRSGSKSMRILP